MTRLTRRTLTATLAASAVIGTLAACSGTASSSTSSGSGGMTMEEGVITLSIVPYMPYIAEEGGELTGLDGDIITAVAEELGYEVEVQTADFSGMLSAVQAKRVDMAAGSIFWTEERAATGLFTDPPYYSPIALAVADGGTYSVASDLEGHDIGTVTGYSWTQSVQETPGATLHTYPDLNGVFNDLQADRIDVGFLDPLAISWTAEKNPALGVETQYLEPPTDAEIAEHPAWKYYRPTMTGFYVSPDAADLGAAFSEAIAAMIADGRMAELIEKWGGEPAQYLTPSDGMLEARLATDRAADWTLPAAQ